MTDIEQRAKSISATVEREYAEWSNTGDLPENVTINSYSFTLSRSGSLGMRSLRTAVMRAIAESNVPRGWEYAVMETVSGDPIFALGPYHA